jgi:Tfp pilus assembly protein PilO
MFAVLKVNNGQRIIEITKLLYAFLLHKSKKAVFYFSFYLCLILNIGVDMKKIMLIFLCCGAMLCFGADSKELLKKQEQALLKQEKQIAKEMFDLRVKLLKEDPALKKMHEKIMELHKELAIQLGSKKEMRILLKKLKKVKLSLAKIEAQSKKK